MPCVIHTSFSKVRKITDIINRVKRGHGYTPNVTPDGILRSVRDRNISLSGYKSCIHHLVRIGI